MRQRYVQLLKQHRKVSLEGSELAEFEELEQKVKAEQTVFQDTMKSLLTAENGKRYRFGSTGQCELLAKKTMYQRKECKKYPQHYIRSEEYTTDELLKKTDEVTSFITHHTLKQNGIPMDMDMSRHRKDMKDSGVSSKFPLKLQLWYEDASQV